MAAQTSSPKSPASKLPIFFLLLTVALLVAGGYYVYTTFQGGPSLSSPLDIAKQVASGGNVMMPKVSENDFKDIDDPLIRKHLAAQINIGKYRIRSTSSGMGDGSEQLMEFMMKGSDVHYRMNQKTSGKDTLDMIVIGDTTYLKDYKDSSWWKQKDKPVEEGKIVADEEEKFKPQDLKEEYTKPNTTYKSLGEEACGSLTCHKYQELDGSNKEANRTFWFDTKELLLRKEVNGFGEFSATQQYSYDNLNLGAPSPTKNVPEGKSIYDYMAAGMMGSETYPTELESGGMMKIKPEDAQKMMEQYGGDEEAPVESSDAY